VRAECHCGSVGASPSRVPCRDSPDQVTSGLEVWSLAIASVLISFLIVVVTWRRARRQATDSVGESGGDERDDASTAILSPTTIISAANREQD
jgi:hypothetical protein